MVLAHARSRVSVQYWIAAFVHAPCNGQIPSELEEVSVKNVELANGHDDSIIVDRVAPQSSG